MNMKTLIRDTKEVHVEDNHKLMEEDELGTKWAFSIFGQIN